MQGKNTTIVLVIVILLALGLVSYWFVRRGRTPVVPTSPTPTLAPEPAPTPGPEVTP